MILLHFNFEDLSKCRTVKEVYETFGIGEGEDISFLDTNVFGKKASYKNMFIAPETYNKVLETLEGFGSINGRNNDKYFVSAAASAWVNYSPMYSGARYQKVKDAIGELNRSVIYILTPGDELFDGEK